MKRVIAAAVLGLALCGQAMAAPTEEQEAREVADLQAQIGMREAADRMADLTKLQVVLTVLGTVGLFATIALTAKSVRVTQDALREQQATAKRELRAYLGILATEVDPVVGGRRVRVVYRFKNFGATPALNIRRMTIRNLPEGDLTDTKIHIPDDFEWNYVPDVMPGSTGSFRLTFTLALSEDLRHGFEVGTRGVQMFSVIEYEDVFGEVHALRLSEIRRGRDLSDNIVNPMAATVDHPRLHERRTRAHVATVVEANRKSLWRNNRARAPGAISTTAGR